MLYLFYCTDCLSEIERKRYYIEGVLCILLMNKYLQLVMFLVTIKNEYIH